jgi:hypothetical protein
VEPIKSSSAPVRRIAPPPWLASKENPTPDPPASPAPLSPKRTKPSSQPSPVKQLDLNSFAFRKRTVGRSASYTTSSRYTSSSKATPEESCSDAPKLAAGPAAKSSSSPKTFYLSARKESPTADATFTAEQVSSLDSCVVCGNAWTVRKLPKSKWTHITSCARKHGCELDTLQLKLIAAVVDASEAKARKAAKGKEKESTGPRTLLAYTIQEHAPPKRHGSRKEPGPSSLQPAEDTRKAILERGTALLGVAPVLDTEGQSLEIVETPVTEQPSQEAEEENILNIPATQTFAPSKIAGRSRFFGKSKSVTLAFAFTECMRRLDNGPNEHRFT